MTSLSPLNSTTEGVKPSTDISDADYIVEVGFEGEGVTGFTKESNWQDVYINEAKKMDQELVNDWKASLNNLLLFVSVYRTRLSVTQYP
jgi:Family of unknown function (DUF6535)